MFKVRSITVKFMIIGTIMFLFFSAYLVFGYMFTKHIKGEAARINLSGRIRMLTMDFGRHMFEASAAGSLPEKHAIAEHVKGEIQQYEEILYALRDGSRKYGIGPVHDKAEKAVAQLDKVIEMWLKDMRLRLQDIFETNNRKEAAEFNARIYEIVGPIDMLVNYIEQHENEEIDRYQKFRLITVMIFILANVFVIIYVKRNMVSPIIGLRNTALEIDHGNFSVKTIIKTEDEIGELGRTVNHMAEHLGLLFMENASHRNRLLENEARLKRAQKIARLGNWEWDIEKNTLQWSDEIYRIFGLEPQSFGADYQAFLSSVHPEDREFVKSSVNEALHDRKTYSIDHRIVLPDSSVRVVHEEAEVTFDEAGRPVRMSGTVQDITERKHTEDRIKYNFQIQYILNSLLRLSLEDIPLAAKLEQCLDVILSAPFLTLLPKGAIFIVEDEPETLVLKANRNLPVPLQGTCAKVPFGRCLCGRAAASRGIQFADCIDERHENIYAGVTQHGHYNVPILSKGKVLGVLVLYLSEGHIKSEEEISFLQATADALAGIVELKTAEDALRKYRDHLEELVDERTKELEIARYSAESANRAKSDFLANMSHELRTPLNAIIGFSEAIKEGLAGDISTEQREYIRDIWESGKHLLRLINDVLDLAKIEAGKMTFDPGEVVIGKLVEDCLLLFREKAMRHEIELSADAAEDIGTIIADELKLKQVILNLLGNAFKFTPDGGSVSVIAQRSRNSEFRIQNNASQAPFNLRGGEGELIEISVTDTGIGISPEDQEKLFQPFQQLESILTKRYEGTGLGLKLCRDYIELHGGKIWVESEAGRGSKFIFTIPAGREGR